MPRVLQILLIAVAGFVVAGVLGYFLILGLSGNRHDRSLEAAMTAVFVCGPLGALVAGVIAFFRTGA